MANIMQQLQLKNKPTKSGFDLSRAIKFTAKVGEATPVGPVKYVIPNSTKKLGIKSFTRTVNVNTAAFARMREYYDFYFVPFELLWNKFDSVITQMKENVQHASGILYSDNEVLSLDMPYFTCESYVSYLKKLKGSVYDKNNFGASRAFNSVRLMSYLGYPDFSPYLQDDFTWEKYPMPNKMLSPFPLLAYQKVYADHIRYSQWEKSNPSTFNLDYIKGTNDLELDITNDVFMRSYNFFDLRYFNYNKDLFFGLLPNVQYGDSSLVTATSSYSSSGSLTLKDFLMTGKPEDHEIDNSFKANSELFFLENAGDDKGVGGYTTNEHYQRALFTIHNAGSFAVNGINSTFSILALRQAEALQRWKEVSQSVDKDYKSQIEAHFGVSVSDYLSHKSTWLNGIYNSLDINAVVNSNLTGDNGADIKGIGTVNNNGSFIFENKDRYGIVICLYHVSPMFDYACGNTDPSVYVTHPTDFPIPEFDRIGMEPVYSHDMCLIPYNASNPNESVPGYVQGVNTIAKPNKIIGYAPRYIKWKTSVDLALGAFTNTEKSWIIPLDLKQLMDALVVSQGMVSVTSFDFTADTFRINPHSVDYIFKAAASDSYDTDHFRVNCEYYDNCVLPLDYNGLPY